jgi:hypothetical protein
VASKEFLIMKALELINDRLEELNMADVRIDSVLQLLASRINSEEKDIDSTVGEKVKIPSLKNTLNIIGAAISWQQHYGNFGLQNPTEYTCNYCSRVGVHGTVTVPVFCVECTSLLSDKILKMRGK